jgi:hypothetical protein
VPSGRRDFNRQRQAGKLFFDGPLQFAEIVDGYGWLMAVIWASVYALHYQHKMAVQNYTGEFEMRSYRFVILFLLFSLALVPRPSVTRAAGATAATFTVNSTDDTADTNLRHVSKSANLALQFGRASCTK